MKVGSFSSTDSSGIHQFSNMLKTQLTVANTLHAIAGVALGVFTIYSGQAPVFLGATAIGAACVGLYIGLSSLIDYLANREERPQYAFSWQSAAFGVATIAFSSLISPAAAAYSQFAPLALVFGMMYSSVQALISLKNNRAEAELKFAESLANEPAKALFWTQKAANRGHHAAMLELPYAEMRLIIHHINGSNSIYKTRTEKMRGVAEAVVELRKDLNQLYNNLNLSKSSLFKRDDPRLQKMARGKDFTFDDVLDYAIANKQNFPLLLDIAIPPQVIKV